MAILLNFVSLRRIFAAGWWSVRFLLTVLGMSLICSVSAFGATYGYASTPLAWIDNASHTDVVWTGAAGAPAPECTGGYAAIDDDITQELPIGFNFTFGATTYSQLRVMSNGRLQFSNPYCYFGTQTVGPPPTYTVPYPNGNLNNTMRVYGADFCPAGGGAGCSGRVTYASLGVAPYRYFVVTWSQMKEWNSGTSLFNVQMILYENGDFVYQYKDVANVSQGDGQTGYQLTSGDYLVIDSTTINSLAYTALRFFKPTPPIAEYRFDECSVSASNSVIDSSGNNLNGTANGGVTAAAGGIVCTGLKFSGASGTYVTVPNNALLNQPYVSVAAWARRTAAAFKSWEAILAKGDTTYRLHLNGGCSINGITTPNAFTFGFNGGCGNADLNSGVVPVANQWYHVVGTYDGVTIKIFVNGILRNSQALTTTIGNNSFPLHIGDNSQQANRNWSGDIDEVKIFDRALPDTEVLSMYNNESLGLQRDGTLRGCSVCNATLGRYNAFESSLPAGTISGVIKTKIAGATFASSSGNIRIVALNAAKTAVDTTANASNIRVEILDASNEAGLPDANGCYAGTTVITTTGNQSISSGVGTISPSPNVAEAYPRVRLRVFSPPGNPTSIGCSSDVFAIRPAYFSVSGGGSQDANWLTAGAARTLSNTAASGGNVHAAGAPFSINGLVARNGANNTTTNYQGSPIILPGNLILPDPSYCAANGYSCAPGNFSIASWNYSSGTLSSSSASYSDVGAFSWEAEDRTFANVDMADSSKIQRYFNSNAVIYTGRFVPASYQLVLNTPMLQTFGSACAARSFTYLGQPFGYAVAPGVSVSAMSGAVAPALTSNYLGTVGSGGLWKLASPLAYSSATCTAPTQTCALTRQSGATRLITTYALGAVTPGWDGSNVATQTGIATIAPSNNGAGALAFGSTDKLALFRDPATPQAPYTATVTLALQLDDYSEGGAVPASCASAPAISGNPTCISGTLAATPLSFDSGNVFRYGRLQLGNAYGSELLDLPIPLEAQYWDPAGYFVKNAADSCTSFNVSSIVLSNFTQNLAACETQLAPTGSQSLVGGKLPLRLLKPGAGNTGSVSLALNIGSVASGSTCTAAAPTPATAADLPWFGTANPSGRATFGVYKTPLIYRRENY